MDIDWAPITVAMQRFCEAVAAAFAPVFAPGTAGARLIDMLSVEDRARRATAKHRRHRARGQRRY